MSLLKSTGKQAKQAADYESYFESQDLLKAGFDRERSRVFLSLWNKFGNKSYLKKKGMKSLDRDVKSLYVSMDRATQDKTELKEQIEDLKKEIENANEEVKKLKSALLDSLEKKLDARKTQYEELETRFKFINLLKTLVDTRNVLGNALIKKVDRAVKNKEFSASVNQEVHSMALNHTEVTEAMDKLDNSIDVYVKSVEQENRREVMY